MDNDFDNKYLGKFIDTPMPEKCLFCGRFFKYWSYEKIENHINICAATNLIHSDPQKLRAGD